MMLLGVVLVFVPVVGWVIHLQLDLVITLGGFILWLIFVVNAHDNQ